MRLKGPVTTGPFKKAHTTGGLLYRVLTLAKIGGCGPAHAMDEYGFKIGACDMIGVSHESL